MGWTVCSCAIQIQSPLCIHFPVAAMVVAFAGRHMVLHGGSGRGRMFLIRMQSGEGIIKNGPAKQYCQQTNK